MTLDLFTVGPPTRGLFRIGKQERPPEEKKPEKSSRKPAGERPSSPRQARDRFFNPFAEALLTAQEAEVERRIIGTLGPASARHGLGAHIDVFA